MIDCDRCDRLLDPAKGTERHELARCRAHIQVPEGNGVELEARIELEHDVILVELCEDRCNLPLAKGVVERVIDSLRCDSQAGRGIAVDVQCRSWGGSLSVGGHVLQ